MDCGNRFKGPDIEWNATSMTAPCQCPQCGGGHTRPATLEGWFFRKAYRTYDGKNEK